jgi:hypothetical protein
MEQLKASLAKHQVNEEHPDLTMALTVYNKKRKFIKHAVNQKVRSRCKRKIIFIL